MDKIFWYRMSPALAIVAETPQPTKGGEELQRKARPEERGECPIFVFQINNKIMSNEIRNLEPKQIWNNFEDINAVPRPSKHEEKIIAFMKAFGEGLGLKTVVDSVGNVIIYKAATEGMEGRKTVILQSHLDMVHQKNADTNFDFSTQGIESVIDGEWVRAKGTTLGADNGIGVASIMSLLQSKDIPHILHWRHCLPLMKKRE